MPVQHEHPIALPRWLPSPGTPPARPTSSSPGPEELDGIITACPLQSGSAMRITDGPWRGLAAILERRVSAREHVLVLLDILQRQTRVELPETRVRLD